MEKILGFLNHKISKLHRKKASLPKLTRLETIKTNEPEEEDVYISINEKNNLTSPDKDYYSNISSKYDEFKEREADKLESTNKILNKFLDKLVPKCDDIFILSQNLAKQISKKAKVNKEIIEEYLKELLKKGKENINKINSNIDRSTSLKLGLNICKIFGTVLSYAYSKMGDFKIKDMKKLIEIRKNIIAQNIDIYKNFRNYCEKHKKDINKEKFSKYCKDNRNKYPCLPELIFLINRFSLVNTVKIELEAFNDLTEVDIQLVELTILNIYFILNSLNTIKLNIISSKFLQSLLIRYNKKFQEECQEIHENMKMHTTVDSFLIYENKWNFINDFKLNEFREGVSSMQTSLMRKTLDLSNNEDSFIYTRTLVEPKRASFFDFVFSKNKNQKITEVTRQEILKKYCPILEIILISIYSLNNSENNFNFELIASDCYIGEFLLAFKKIYDMEWIENEFSQFHIFDLLLYNNIIKRIQKLNIEINTLDPFSFDKLLNFLYYNKTLTSINLSLFSSDVTYYPAFIYKLFGKYFKIKEINNNSDDYLFIDDRNIEQIMLNNMSDLFVYHMSVLFEVIKKKKNLEELGFNFDIPLNIQRNKNYMNSIFKFIINTLILVTRSRIKKFCLLSPSTEIDCRMNPDINYLVNEINFNKNNFLENLSIQMIFFKIENIKNFITTRLKILNIGDLDLTTLKLLANHICSYNFNKNSSLEKLTISLLNTIFDFSLDIKLIFEKLFKIKIKNFVSLSIYTNIILKDKYEYLYLLKIMNNNWISEYLITFNKISQELIKHNKNELKKLEYLIPHNLEEKLLEDKDLINLLKNNDKNTTFVQNINKNVDFNDEAYWSVKYYLNKTIKGFLNNEEITKNIIFGILKYIYCTKNPKVSHSLENKIKEFMKK